MANIDCSFVVAVARGVHADKRLFGVVAVVGLALAGGLKPARRAESIIAACGRCNSHHAPKEFQRRAINYARLPRQFKGVIVRVVLIDLLALFQQIQRVLSPDCAGHKLSVLYDVGVVKTGNPECGGRVQPTNLVRFADCGARVAQHQHNADAAGGHRLHGVEDKLRHTLGLINYKHQVFAVLPLGALGSGPAAVVRGLAFDEMVGPITDARLAVQHSAGQPLAFALRANFFEEQIVDLFRRRRKAVNDRRRKIIKEMADHARAQRRLADGVPRVHADPVLNHLAGLPVFKLAGRQLAVFKIAAFVLLAQGQRVSVQHLLLAGAFCRSTPRLPFQHFADIPARLKPVFEHAGADFRFGFRLPGGALVAIQPRLITGVGLRW